MKKAISLLLVLVMTAALFTACGGSAKKNVSVSELSAKVSETIGKTDSLVAVDSNYIRGYMKVDAAQFGEYSMMINAYGANIDEYGIFKAGDMSAKDIEAAVNAYLELRKAAWMDEYMPEEKPKLTNAEVRVSGDYVMYCILSDDDKAAAFGAFEDALK